MNVTRAQDVKGKVEQKEFKEAGWGGGVVQPHRALQGWWKELDVWLCARANKVKAEYMCSNVWW